MTKMLMKVGIEAVLDLAVTGKLMLKICRDYHQWRQ